MPDSMPATGSHRPRNHEPAASGSGSAQPVSSRARAGAILGWLWAFALIGLLAYDVWMQTRPAQAGVDRQLLVWGVLLALAVIGPWYLIRTPAAERALRTMPLAVLCYLAASVLVSEWYADTRYAVLLFVAAGLAGCAGMIVAIAGRRR
jgi:hypothetical protein